MCRRCKFEKYLQTSEAQWLRKAGIKSLDELTRIPTPDYVNHSIYTMQNSRIKHLRYEDGEWETVSYYH